MRSVSVSETGREAKDQEAKAPRGLRFHLEKAGMETEPGKASASCLHIPASSHEVTKTVAKEEDLHFAVLFAAARHGRRHKRRRGRTGVQFAFL